MSSFASGAQEPARTDLGGGRISPEAVAPAKFSDQQSLKVLLCSVHSNCRVTNYLLPEAGDRHRQGLQPYYPDARIILLLHMRTYTIVCRRSVPEAPT
jgi:hypothetical protein